MEQKLSPSVDLNISNNEVRKSDFGCRGKSVDGEDSNQVQSGSEDLVFGFTPFL